LIKLETVMKKVRETAAQMMATAMQMTEQPMQMLTMLLPMPTVRMTLRRMLTQAALEIQPTTLPQIQIVAQLAAQLAAQQVQLIGLPRPQRLFKKLKQQRVSPLQEPRLPRKAMQFR
jgi:hypothetical protein